MARRRTATGKVDAKLPPFPCRTSPDVTRPLWSCSGAALEGQEKGLSGVGAPPCVFLLVRSRSGSRCSRSARWTRHGCPRSRSRRWFPSFPPARSVRLPAAAPSFPLSPPSRFARSRGCPAERRSFPPSGLPGPAPRLLGFPPALLIRRCCCPPGPFISK